MAAIPTLSGELAAQRIVRNRIDGVDDLGVILQQIVNHDRPAGLVLRHQLIHLFHALLGEDQIELEPFVGFLHQADLIGFVVGEKIPPADLRKQRKSDGKQEPRKSFHFFFPMIPVISLS